MLDGFEIDDGLGNEPVVRQVDLRRKPEANAVREVVPAEP